MFILQLIATSLAVILAFLLPLLSWM